MPAQNDVIGEAREAAARTLGDIPEPPADMTMPDYGYPNLAAALAAFQADRPSLTKTNTADVVKEGRKLYSYQYADLADVEETVLPMLGAVGIAWYCHTEAINGAMSLVCTLEHESGDRRSSVFPLQAKLTDPQGLGSYLTYFQRYALMMMTGVHAAGEDDDGQRAQASARQEPAERRETERPDPGPGTRQGGANDAAKAIIAASAEKLPGIWERVVALGIADNRLSANTGRSMMAHLDSLGISEDTVAGQMLPGLEDRNLRAIAAFQLVRLARQETTAEGTAKVDKAYMAMCQMDISFAALRIPGGDKLGDYLALRTASARAADSEPGYRSDPPWVTSADVPYGQLENGPDVTAYDADDAEANDIGYGDDTEGHPGDNRAAVLEGT